MLRRAVALLLALLLTAETPLLAAGKLGSFGRQGDPHADSRVVSPRRGPLSLWRQSGSPPSGQRVKRPADVQRATIVYDADRASFVVEPEPETELPRLEAARKAPDGVNAELRRVAVDPRGYDGGDSRQRTADVSAPDVVDLESVAADRGEAQHLSARSDPQPKPVRLPPSLRGEFIGHDIVLNFGLNVAAVSLPFLIEETLGLGAAAVAAASTVDFTVAALVSILPVGLLIDKTSFRALFPAVALLRQLAVAQIPLLYYFGLLSLPALLAIVGVHAAFHAVTRVADAAAPKIFIGTNERATRVLRGRIEWYTALGEIFYPLIAGGLVTGMVHAFGVGGYAYAFVLQAAAFGLAAPIFWKTIRDPRDPRTLGWAGFLEFSRGAGEFFWAVARLLAGIPGWLLRRGWRRPASGNTRREVVASALDDLEATRGIAYVLRNRTLRLLLGVHSMQYLIEDALPRIVIPALIAYFLVGPLAPWLAWVAGVGLMGVIYALEQFAHFITNNRMEEGRLGDRLLRRFGERRFMLLASLAPLLTGLYWLVPFILFPASPSAAVLVMLIVPFLVAFLRGPVSMVTAPLRRIHTPDELAGRIDSVFMSADHLVAALGSLLLAGLFLFLPVSAAVGFAAAGFVGLVAAGWTLTNRLYPAGGTAPRPGFGGSELPAWLREARELQSRVQQRAEELRDGIPELAGLDAFEEGPDRVPGLALDLSPGADPRALRAALPQFEPGLAGWAARLRGGRLELIASGVRPSG